MDRALLARVEKQAWFHRYPRAVPLALLVVGLLATGLFINNFERLDHAARQAQLEREATALAKELQYKSAENIVYLNAAASLFAVADDVSQAEFQEFISDMSADWQARGVVGMGWARWIKAREARGFEASQRGFHGSDAYAVRPVPADPGQDMGVISLLAPLNGPNRFALGFDMYSEGVRRTAMDAAMRTGNATVSGRVQLLQDAGNGQMPGFLVYVPVFERRPATTGGPAGRARGALKGFVYTPVRARDFLRTALDRVSHHAQNVRLHDGAPGQGRLLASTMASDIAGTTVTRRVQVGDRAWTLEVTAIEPRGLAQESLLTLLFGCLVSVLLSALAWLATSRAADDRKVLEWLTRQSAIRTSLTRELNHRVKNTLANVLSIVSLTRRRSRGIDDFAEGLTGRIRALSATHDLLSQRDWRDAPLREVVTSELAPYLDPDDPHADLDGPDIALAPNDALSLGLALHELATNAAKYGALSTAGGRVSVQWRLSDPGTCEVAWTEAGGPPAQAPTRRGFGLDLIEKIVSHELRTPVEIDFAEAGLRCLLRVPVREQAAFAIREGRAG